MASHAPVIVCERKGLWGPLLRRALEKNGVSIRETISLAGCWDEIQATQHGFAVLEYNAANAVGVCDLIRRICLCFPQTRVAIVGGREMRFHEWPVREAGAQHVVFSPRRLEPLTRIIRRHLESSITREINHGLRPISKK